MSTTIPLVTPPLPTRRRTSVLADDVTGVFLGVRHRETSDVEDGDIRTREPDAKRTKTSQILDPANIPDTNVLLSLRSIVTLLSSMYACKGCRKATDMTM